MVIKNIVRGHVVTIEFEGVEELCEELLKNPSINELDCDYLDINVPIYVVDSTHAIYYIEGDAMPIVKHSPNDGYWHFDFK